MCDDLILMYIETLKCVAEAARKLYKNEDFLGYYRDDQTCGVCGYGSNEHSGDCAKIALMNALAELAFLDAIE